VPWLVAGFLVIAGLTYIAYIGINRNSPPEVARIINSVNRFAFASGAKGFGVPVDEP